jgi:hypothetical protein
LIYFSTMWLLIWKENLKVLKYLNKFIMIMMSMFAMLLNFSANGFVLTSFIVSNYCYFMLQASSDPFYADNLLASDLKGVVKRCVLPTSDGNILPVFEFYHSDYVSQVNNLTKSVATIFDDSFAQNLTVSSVPFVGTTQLQTMWESYFNCKDDDLTSMTGNITTVGLKFGVKDFNSHMSSTSHSNRMQLNGQCTSGYTLSATTDTETFMQSSSDQYCLQMCSFPNNNAAVASRYDSGSYSGASDARVKYNTVLNSVNKYKSLFTTGGANSFRSLYGSPSGSGGLSVAEQNYLNLLKDAYTQLQTLRTAAKEMSDFMKNFGNNVSNSLNCSIMGVHFRQLQVAMCVKTGSQFISQTNTLMWLGALVFLFSWCMCCGIRCLPVPEPLEQVPTNPTLTLPFLSQNDMLFTDHSFTLDPYLGSPTAPTSEQVSPIYQKCDNQMGYNEESELHL